MRERAPAPYSAAVRTCARGLTTTRARAHPCSSTGGCPGPDAGAEEDEAHPLPPLWSARGPLPTTPAGARARGAPQLLSANSRRAGRGAPAWAIHAFVERGLTGPWRVRAGNHPTVSGGDDCLSRKSANLRSHTSGDSHTGEADKRKSVGGTVTHH